METATQKKPAARFTADEIASARAEARRELARKFLTDFCCFIDPAAAQDYGSAHMRVMAAKLEQVASGKCQRLFITAPPRHWKSSLVMEKFALHFLANYPEKSVGMFSHGTSLPIRFSRNVRNNIDSNPRFHELYPDVRIKQDSSNVTDWAIDGTYRSSCRAFGVGSSPTGEGFDLILIDDPVADDKEAYNLAALEGIYDWYRETLRDRLNPGGAIVLVMSRWHEMDLAGRLLKESAAGSGERWEVLKLSALAEPGDIMGRKEGEALWPEKWPLKALMDLKAAAGSRAFAARFQGSPRASEGNVLNSMLLKMIDASEVPPLVKVVRHWDLAFSENRGADFVTGVKMGLAEDGRRVILHVKRIHGRWTMSKPVIVAVSHQDDLRCVVSIEGNGTQLGYYQEMHDDVRMADRVVALYQPDGSKEMRASMWGTRLTDGIILCVRGEWNQELFDEMDMFPAAEHDDVVDGVSGAWAQLAASTGSMRPGDFHTGGRPAGEDPELEFTRLEFDERNL